MDGVEVLDLGLLLLLSEVKVGSLFVGVNDAW
jgi:hypothetical protein